MWSVAGGIVGDVICSEEKKRGVGRGLEPRTVSWVLSRWVGVFKKKKEKGES